MNRFKAACSVTKKLKFLIAKMIKLAMCLAPFVVSIYIEYRLCLLEVKHLGAKI